MDRTLSHDLNKLAKLRLVEGNTRGMAMKWIEVEEKFHLGHPGLPEEVEARLAAQLPPGQCIKGPINIPPTSRPAVRPGWIRYQVGYETEPCQMTPNPRE